MCVIAKENTNILQYEVMQNYLCVFISILTIRNLYFIHYSSGGRLILVMIVFAPIFLNFFSDSKIVMVAFQFSTKSERLLRTSSKPY